VEDLPPSIAEVAFAGRSNVGKSSLINALANQRQLAVVSKTPGRTRLLNLFEVEPSSKRGDEAEGTPRTLVDLPGYGYANVPQRVRDGWARMIEEYLLNRKSLRMVVLLVDGAVGPTALDVQMVEWAAHHDLPLHAVATKQDKVGPSRLERRKLELAAGLDRSPDDVTWVSASKRLNLDRLRSQVRSWVGA
jgi:GTP-binding protein